MGADAAVPPGLWERIRQIVSDELGKLMRSGALRSAAITGGAGLRIGPGSKLVVQHPDGRTLLLLGAYDSSDAFNMPDGSRQPMALLRRADGTLALAMYDPNPGDGFQQFLSLLDRSGNFIVSDDTASGQGLARPYVPGAFYRARNGDWPVVTGTSFETVYRARMTKQHPRLYVTAWGASNTAGGVGEMRILVNGTQLDATRTTAFGTVAEYVFGPLPVAGGHMADLAVEIQARLASGSGGVQVGAGRVEGRQS